MEGNGEVDQQWSVMESLINKLQGREKRFQNFCCKSLGGKSDLQQVFRWLGERRERGAHEICPDLKGPYFQRESGRN